MKLEQHKVIPLIVLIVILLVGGYSMYYRPPSEVFESPVVEETDISEADDAQLTCVNVNKKLGRMGDTNTYYKDKLIPVETKINRHLLVNDAHLLVLKEFNMGGSSYEVEGKAGKSFAGQGPYHIPFLYDFPTDLNLSIMPATSLPSDVGERFFSSGPDRGFMSAAPAGNTWLVLGKDHCLYGDLCGVTFFRLSDGHFEEIAIPEGYQPTHKIHGYEYEGYTANDNDQTLVDIVETGDSTITFLLGLRDYIDPDDKKPRTAVTYNIDTGEWGEPFPYEMERIKQSVTISQNRKKHVEELAEETGCFAVPTDLGDVLFLPHKLYEPYWEGDKTDLLDMYYAPSSE